MSRLVRLLFETDIVISGFIWNKIYFKYLFVLGITDSRKPDSTLNQTPKSMWKTKPRKTRITDRKAHYGVERTLLATD